MIDHIDRLTFSLHANKGAYALLLGSGVSRAASIPTGWEVVEDLVRRVAMLRRAPCEPTPTAWYRETFGDTPTYSGLLKLLAPTPLERQQLIRGYFEPNEDERDQGLKVPTKAHRAVANLAAKGHFRIILTTNFDRLIESALEASGIVPTVVGTPDQIQGLPPLLQVPCLVVKLHGDYLDSRIKNTPEELGQYERRVNRLLDRIFDEFGLIVCGWSAEWDPALCSAISRCRSHRFSTYWAHRGPIATEATRLISLRRAEAIPITGADAFFESLADKIEALETYDRPHPLSLRLAVEALKNYLVDARHRIRLSDLLSQEAESAYENLFVPGRPISEVPYDSEHLFERLQQYEAAIERLQALLITGAAWGEPEHLDVWRKAVARIATPPRPQSPYIQAWASAREYPAIRLLYASGIAAIARGRFDNLKGLLDVPAYSEAANTKVTLLALPTYETVDSHTLNLALKSNYRLPMSEYLSRGLREPLREYLPSDDDYERTFDLLEYLLALEHLHQNPNDYGITPPGRYLYKRTVIKNVSSQVDSLGTAWPPIKAGFFDGVVANFRAAEQMIKPERFR